MPIEHKTVLTCGQCGATKAQANGWYLIGEIADGAVRISPAHNPEKLLEIAGTHQQIFGEPLEAACGRECVMKLVSRLLEASTKGSEKHGEENNPT